MLQTVHNSDLSRTMDLFKEIDDLSDLFLLEKNTKLDCPNEGYEDLQSKYSSLHENYAKEIENSKKVEKCLIKCLKFYSKLSKKYEVQQQIIRNLEESIKEKVSSLEEAQKNEEKMKGLIEVYRTERTVYAGNTDSQLRKDKENLLDICCKLIGESVKTHSINNLSNLFLRKFRKDLNYDRLNWLKGRNLKLKVEQSDGDVKPEIALKEEFKTEDKYSGDVAKVEMKHSPPDTKSDEQLDLSPTAEEDNSLVENDDNPHDLSDKLPLEPEVPGVVPSLPSLEEFPISPEHQHRDDVSMECDQCQDGSNVQTEDTSDSSLDVSKTQCSLELPTLTSESERKPEEPPVWSATGSTSIFDISDPNDRGSKQQETAVVDAELSFISETKPNEKDKTGTDVMDKEDDYSVLQYEDEVFRIFREMSSIRLLSPIRETNSSTPAKTVTDESNNLKRNSEVEGNCCKNKKLKSEETECCLLDSIMSAMSIQNEEFKSKKFEGGSSGEESRGFTSPRGARMQTRRRRLESERVKSEGKSAVVCNSPVRGQQTSERLVMEELKKFVSSPISCKEDADRNVRQCVSVLGNKSQDVIAKCIVSIVLENIDEPVEVFERPAPPLTKTQQRLIVLLSVFRSLEWDSDKISTKILSILSEKLFPDDFFWPDDCVESAVRFYAALSKARNDPKTLWKFCLAGMTEMRQRSPLLVFTLLKTWPDVLHDASTLKNNILAVTIVNIFLHMPKAEGLRNGNQNRKLAALKHLLVKFYQFKMEDTIESYAKKVLDGIVREEVGSEKALVLLAKCKGQSWTVQNVLPPLKACLGDWVEGRVTDSVAGVILSVIKQICPMLLQEKGSGAKVKEFAGCLTGILTSRKMSHDSEVNLIEVLLLLKQYPEVRKVICEWIPKNPIKNCLRNEIINASAENILRELKLNRKKETRSFTPKKKQQWKKTKGKTKKGKKKSQNQKTKTDSTGFSCRK